jgi:hypothetical protein
VAEEELPPRGHCNPDSPTPFLTINQDAVLALRAVPAANTTLASVGAQPFSQHSKLGAHAPPARQQVSLDVTQVPSRQQAVTGSGQQRPDAENEAVS